MTDAFWAARPALQHVLTLARARGVGPWAVLGSVLARAIATIPPEITLPGIVGSRMSLNLFIALVGPSGGGKGAAEATALDGFSLPYIEIVPLGTGEGIARTYRPVGTKPDDPDVIANAIFTAPEIDTVATLASRHGSPSRLNCARCTPVSSSASATPARTPASSCPLAPTAPA